MEINEDCYNVQKVTRLTAPNLIAQVDKLESSRVFTAQEIAEIRRSILLVADCDGRS